MKEEMNERNRMYKSGDEQKEGEFVSYIETLDKDDKIICAIEVSHRSR